MTIVDLARQTGYSVGTVSRVLNHQPNVSQKAKDAILAAARENGFQLNTNAQNLRQQYPRGVLAVVKGTSNELFARVVEQMQQRLSDSDYPLLLHYIDEDDNEILRAEQLCREKKPLGLLILGGSRRNFDSFFSKISVPSVLVTGDASEMAYDNLSSVTTDDRRAAETAMRYLLENGHRRVAVIGGNTKISDTSRLRYEGCANACAAMGLSFDETIDYGFARYSLRGGYEAMRSILERCSGITAVFAMADVMALGAIRALREHRYQVPQDVSVIGFDGIEIGDYCYPKLTTISQSVNEIAQRSIEILLSQISAPSRPIHEAVPYRLVCRESVKQL